MSAKYVTAIFALVMMMMMMSAVFPAHAVQLDAVIPKSSEEFSPVFTFTRIVSIQYHSEDSKLAEMVGDSQQKIAFGIDSQNGGILADMINSELQKKSFVSVNDISGEYSAIITPHEKSMSIEYRIVLHPTMQGHFISESVLDSQWRGFEIDGEIPMETKYGTYDMNSPMSAFVKMPGVSRLLSESDAMKVLDLKLVDASGLSELPLSKWESMFDPTAKMSETEKFGFSGSVITNYSMGICTVYLGVCQDRDYTESFQIEGEEYIIRSVESQDDGTIVIEGYVQERVLDKTEMFLVSDNAPPRGDENDTQVPVLYTVSGIGVAIAAGFFVWSDRKSKNTSTEQTGIDPKDLCATAIGSSAGSYQTNRATAHLREY